jgi:hypothetical protein
VFKIVSKDAYGWCGKTLKYGLFLGVCYWLVTVYNEWERTAAEQKHDREVSKKCSQKLAALEHVPILGGGLLDRNKIPGFHFGSSTRNGLCIADVLEGSFWWTGTELRATYLEVANKRPAGWRLFSVNARLYTRSESTEPYTMGRQTVDWPDELTVKLKNYPGLELWLTALPPSPLNEFSIKNFIITDWRRRDGTPRVIACNGLTSPSTQVLESGLGAEVLLTLNKLQLENLDFGVFNVYCTVGLHDFDFAGGDARVRLGTAALVGAPEALKFMSEHLSSSILTRK